MKHFISCLALHCHPERTCPAKNESKDSNAQYPSIGLKAKTSGVSNGAYSPGGLPVFSCLGFAAAGFIYYSPLPLKAHKFLTKPSSLPLKGIPDKGTSVAHGGANYKL